MIILNRLNHETIVINADLIEKMEAAPEVVLTLTTGRRIIVRQSLEEVMEALSEYRRTRQFIAPAPPPAEEGV